MSTPAGPGETADIRARAERVDLNMLETAMDTMRRLAPREARHAPMSVVELDGGLSNRSFRVQLGSNSYLVKLLAPPGPLGVNRRAERCNAAIAADLGLGPRLLHRRLEASIVEETRSDPDGALTGGDPPVPDLLIQEWIPGLPMTAAEFDDPRLLAAVATACRTLHDGPAFGNTIDMFDVHTDYLHTCDERGLVLPADYRRFLPAITSMRAALTLRAEPRVPCHNDLRPSNLLNNNGTISMIDFEYSGNNDRLFELGNLAAEANLTHDHLAELLRHYRGRLEPADLARTQLFRILSEYGWILWAIVRESTDWPSYGGVSHDLCRERGEQLYARAARQLSAPTFESLLAAAAG